MAETDVDVVNPSLGVSDSEEVFVGIVAPKVRDLLFEVLSES